MEHIQISWDDEDHTVICCVFMQGWTVEDFHEAFEQTNEMIRQSPNLSLNSIKLRKSLLKTPVS